MTPDNRNDTKIDKSSGFLSGLIALKLICCGGLILLATGGLSGLGTWFSGVSIAVAGGLALAVFAILLIWRGIVSRQDSSLHEARPVQARLAVAGP